MSGINTYVPPATTSAPGIIEVATDVEAQAASATNRAVCPGNITAILNQFVIGYNQTWQDVAGSRSAGTSYQNTTGKPIQIAITLSSGGTYAQVSSNNSTWIDVGGGGSDRNTNCNAIVPNNWYYRTQAGAVIAKWAELR